EPPKQTASWPSGADAMGPTRSATNRDPGSIVIGLLPGWPGGRGSGGGEGVAGGRPRPRARRRSRRSRLLRPRFPAPGPPAKIGSTARRGPHTVATTDAFEEPSHAGRPGRVRVSPPLVFAAALLAAVTAAGCGAGDGGGKGGRPSSAPSGAPSSQTSPSREPDAWLPGHVAKMSLADHAGQLFVPTFSSRADAVEKIRKYRVGGLIYFPENISTPERTAAQSNALQKASKIPLLLGVDEEQGIVSRTPFVTRFPGNMALGATGDPSLAKAAAPVTGTELRAVGITLHYAPDADVNVNPRNPVIGLRSFGADPAPVSRMVAGAVSGYQAAGIAAAAKHFPGHGDTATDSHTGLPVIGHSPAEWRRVDAPPFKAAVDAGADMIMTAHIVVPKLDRSGDPATLSKTVLTGLLRNELGYQGVITTDSLLMAGVRQKYGDAEVPVRAINAGADQLLMPPSLPRAYRAVLNAVRTGKISERRLDESVTRILRLKQRRGLFQGTAADPAEARAAIGTAGHRAVARRVAEGAVTLVRND